MSEYEKMREAMAEKLYTIIHADLTIVPWNKQGEGNKEWFRHKYVDPLFDLKVGKLKLAVVDDAIIEG